VGNQGIERYFPAGTIDVTPKSLGTWPEHYAQDAKRQGVGSSESASSLCAKSHANHDSIPGKLDYDQLFTVFRKLRMFTEGIVHECFKKLLANVRSCKLLTAVGKRLDRRKACARMDAYSSRMKGSEVVI
jgi:hypothetical protein